MKATPDADKPNPKCKCLRCGHEWFSELAAKGIKPKACPACKQYKWNKPKV